MTMNKPVIPVCNECGSHNLAFDAYSEWDADNQRFSVVNTSLDTVWCNSDKCTGDYTSVTWRPIEEETQ